MNPRALPCPFSATSTASGSSDRPVKNAAMSLACSDSVPSSQSARRNSSHVAASRGVTGRTRTARAIIDRRLSDDPVSAGLARAPAGAAVAAGVAPESLVVPVSWWVALPSLGLRHGAPRAVVLQWLENIRALGVAKAASMALVYAPGGKAEQIFHTASRGNRIAETRRHATPSEATFNEHLFVDLAHERSGMGARVPGKCRIDAAGRRDGAADGLPLLVCLLGLLDHRRAVVSPPDITECENADDQSEHDPNDDQNYVNRLRHGSVRGSWDKIILRPDDLPPASPFHPCVGKPIATIERSARAASLHHEPSCDERGRAKAVHLHRFVVRRRDRVGSRTDLMQYGDAVHCLVVLGVDEPGSQQSLKHNRVALDQRARPIVLEAQQCARISVLRLCEKQHRDQ